MNNSYEICSQAEMAKVRDLLNRCVVERIKINSIVNVPDEERPMKIKIEEIPNE